MFQLPPARLFQEVFAFFPRSLCISRDIEAMNGIAILLGTTHTYFSSITSSSALAGAAACHSAQHPAAGTAGS